MTADGVTGQKHVPERDFIPTISTKSCRRRGATHMPSVGVPTTGPSVQYGVHTDQKLMCSGAHFDVDFFGLLLFCVVAPGDKIKKRMPDRRQHPPTAVDVVRSYTRPLQAFKISKQALSIFECTQPADGRELKYGSVMIFCAWHFFTGCLHA